MTWGRAALLGIAIWLAALCLLLQPRHHAPPPVEHARRLDVTAGPLATLAPLRP